MELSWQDVRALRSAYVQGIRTIETREANRLYVFEVRKQKLKKRKSKTVKSKRVRKCVA